MSYLRYKVFDKITFKVMKKIILKRDTLYKREIVYKHGGSLTNFKETMCLSKQLSSK